MSTEAKKPFLSERDVYAYMGCNDDSVMPIHEMQRLYEAELERVNLAWKKAFDLGHDWQEKAKEHEKTIADLTVRLVAQQKIGYAMWERLGAFDDGGTPLSDLRKEWLSTVTPKSSRP